MGEVPGVRLNRNGWIVFALMGASAVMTVIRYTQSLAMTAAIEPPVGSGWFVSVVFVGLVSIAISLLVGWTVLRGMKAAPFLVTLVALWDSYTIVSWGDLLSWVSAALSVVAIVLVWMPSTRANAARLREDRLRAKASRFTPTRLRES